MVNWEPQGRFAIFEHQTVDCIQPFVSRHVRRRIHTQPFVFNLHTQLIYVDVFKAFDHSQNFSKATVWNEKLSF